ncbi:MAG: hypothetical protein HKN47_03110 [Pirellulaceae bacterium]|nr:hypothetical protein [Pirellulaceae bacterium]
MIQNDLAQFASALSVAARCLIVATLLFAVGILSGCRLCDTSEDLAYPAYGGAWQRTVRDSGRVGSLFDPAGARASELVSREAPITADELERSRREEEDKADRPSDETDDEDPESSASDDPMDLGPDQNDGTPNLDPSDDSPSDPELEDRKRKLRDQDLEDIKIIPGDALPPLMR